MCDVRPVYHPSGRLTRRLTAWVRHRSMAISDLYCMVTVRSPFSNLPCPHLMRQPRPLNPLSQRVSRTSALALHTSIQPDHGQQSQRESQSRTRVALSPSLAASQHSSELCEEAENDQEIGEAGEKRAREMLQDALEKVSIKRRKKRGFVKYVLLDT